VNRLGDNIAFGLIVGIPLALLCWGASTMLALVVGRPAAWVVAGAVILAWPAYYVSTTHDDSQFTDGLGLLVLTAPAMMLGWIVALARVSRR
jgi:hypothetical protein